MIYNNIHISHMYLQIKKEKSKKNYKKYKNLKK